MIASGELVFEASAEPMACTGGIMILEDQTLEHREMFLLLLISADHSVNSDPIASQLTIEINDTTSE